MFARQVNRIVGLLIAAMLLTCTPVMASDDNRIDTMYSIIDRLVRNNENLVQYFSNHGVAMESIASCSYSAMLLSGEVVLRDNTAIALEYFVNRRARNEFTIVVKVDEKNDCITDNDIIDKYDFDFIRTDFDEFGSEMLYETTGPSFYHLHFLFYGKEKQCLRGVELITSDENICQLTKSP